MYKNISEFIKHTYQMHFELAAAISAIMIVLIAAVMDKFLYLQACPMCILTRYVFGLIALSAIIGILFKKPIIGQLLIIISSLIGILVTTRQIYIQNMPIEDISKLSGCGMPFNTQVEYFGIIEAIKKTLAGGPSCAEDGWRFIFNFADIFISIGVILLIFFEVFKKRT